MGRGNLLFVIGITALLGAVILWRSGPSAMPPVFERTPPLREAIRGAGDRPVLAFFTADWCAPCQALKRGPLRDASVEALIRERTVPVYVDVTSVNQGDKASAAVMEEFGVRALPTLVLLRGDEQLSRIEGGASEAELREWLVRTTAAAPAK